MNILPQELVKIILSKRSAALQDACKEFRTLYKESVGSLTVDSDDIDFDDVERCAKTLPCLSSLSLIHSEWKLDWILREDLLAHLSQSTIGLRKIALRNMTVETLTPLASLRRLTEIEVADVIESTSFAALTDLGELRTLVWVPSRQSRTTKDMEGIGKLSQLKSLYIYEEEDDNLIEDIDLMIVEDDIEWLSGLVSLETLHFDFPSIRDFSSLGKMNNLRDICLKKITYLDLDDDVRSVMPLAALSALTSLLLQNHPLHYEGSDLSPLSTLTRLKILDVDLGVGVESALAGLSGLDVFRFGEFVDIPRMSRMFSSSLSNLCTVRLSTHFYDDDEFDDDELEQFVPLLDSFQNLDKLNTLEISGYPIVSKSLPPMRHLTRLVIERAQGFDMFRPTVMCRLTNLQELCIHDCPMLTHISFGYGVNTALEKLDLSGNENLEDIRGLRHMTSLLELDLGGCYKVREFHHLNSLSRLRRLDLSKTMIKSLVPLGSLRELRELRIVGSKIDSVDFKLLTNIEVLDLSHNAIVGFETSSEHLRRLDLSDNCIERVNMDVKMPNLESLSLRRNRLRYFGDLAVICPNVEYLDLSWNHLGNQGIRNLNSRELHRLKKIDLSVNNITDTLKHTIHPYARVAL